MMFFSSQRKLDSIEQDLKGLGMRNYRPIWQSFMEKYGCNYICSLGLYRNDPNFTEMIAHQPHLALGVDNSEDVEYFKDQFKDSPFVKIIKEYPSEAAKLYRNNYFDFVYVDSDTAAASYYHNITSWYPKVKHGKFLVGHNYNKGYGVIEAVDRFVKENNLKLMWRLPSMWAVVKP